MVKGELEMHSRGSTCSSIYLVMDGDESIYIYNDLSFF